MYITLCATNILKPLRLAHRPIYKTAKRLHHPSLPHSIKNLHFAKQQKHQRYEHTLPINATQTHPSASPPQIILVLHPPTPGLPIPTSKNHRRTRPTPPRKVPPPHPRSQHTLLLRIAPSLRPRSTLLLPHFTPLAPHTRLRSAESENSSPSPPSRLSILPRSHLTHLPTLPPIRLRNRHPTNARPTSSS